MKEWWNALSLRDKRMVSLGSVLIVIIASYAFIWNPLVVKNEALHQQVQANKKLVIWMRAAIQQIHTLERKPSEHQFGHSPLSIIQEALKKSSLIESITELKQTENDAVQLHFQAISFDKLMAWLVELYQEQGFVVGRIEVNSNDKLGSANGEMTLQRSAVEK